MTYAELKTNIAAWLHRDDLTGYLDTFIALFEARANRTLRTVEMQVLETVTPTSEFHALPTGWQAFKNVQYNGTYATTIEYASPQKIAAAGLISGDPAYYTLNGNQVEFSPSAEGKTIEWTYYQAIPALSSSNTSNWLIEKHPDYYLWGCIHQALLWALDDRAAQVAQMVGGYESEIESASRNAYSGPLNVTAS